MSSIVLTLMIQDNSMYTFHWISFIQFCEKNCTNKCYKTESNVTSYFDGEILTNEVWKLLTSKNLTKWASHAVKCVFGKIWWMTKNSSKWLLSKCCAIQYTPIAIHHLFTFWWWVVHFLNNSDNNYLNTLVR